MEAAAGNRSLDGRPPAGEMSALRFLLADRLIARPDASQIGSLQLGKESSRHDRSRRWEGGAARGRRARRGHGLPSPPPRRRPFVLQPAVNAFVAETTAVRIIIHQRQEWSIQLPRHREFETDILRLFKQRSYITLHK